MGTFESNEYGKFSLNVNDIKKDFFLGVSNSIELERVRSSDFLIDSFFKKNKIIFTVLLG